MEATTTRDADTRDPKQRTPDSIPAKSCQGLQKHRTASGYFVMNEELVGFPCLHAHSGVRFISLSTEPNTLQFVQCRYQFLNAEFSKLVWERWGFLGWLRGGVCVCVLLNKLRPACSSSLLVISNKNIFKFSRGTFLDTEK